MTLIDCTMKYKVNIQDIITMYYEHGVEDEKDVRKYILESYCPNYYIDGVEPPKLNKQKECAHYVKEGNESKCAKCRNRDYFVRLNDEKLEEYQLYLKLHKKYKDL